MKRILVLIIFLGINLTIFPQNYTTNFIDNQNQAAFDFYSNHLSENKNQAFAPFFVNTNFSMLYLATGGGTARQVADFMYFNHDKNTHYGNMQILQKIITDNNSLNTNFKYSINLFIEDSLKVLNKYNQTIKPYLCDSVQNIDFTTDLNTIATTINDIIEQNTNNYIQGYLKSDYLPQNPNILLNSSAYFSGFWANNFQNYITTTFELDSLGRTRSNVDYLTTFDYIKYNETDEYQIIELPYEGFQFSLIIILPQKTKNLQNFEELFTYETYKMWHQYNLQRQKVRVLLPEFEIENLYSIKEDIDTIIPAVFQKGGNFLNLIKKIVFVNGIYHYAKISVVREDNNLSELDYYNFEQEKQINDSFIFNANHPFIFLVIHRQSQAIMYMGHYYGQ